MLGIIGPIASLLLGIGLLLMGSASLGTLLGLRAHLEAFPNAVIGAVMSSYFLGFLLGTLRCPALIRRVGHIRVYATLAATAALSTVAHALLVEPFAWAALRILTGWSLAGLYITVESWLNVATANEQRGKVLAAYAIVTLFSGAAGQYLLLTGDPGRETLFILAAIFFLLGVPPVTLTRMREPETVPDPGLDLRRIGNLSPLGTAGAVASGFTNGAYWGMGPVFAKTVGLDDAGVAAFMSAVVLGGAAVQWPVGHYSDGRDRRRVLVAVCCAGVCSALGGAFAAGHSTKALLACAFLYGGTTFTVYPLSLAHVNDQTEGRESLEATRALLMLYGVGAVFGPVVVGALMGFFGPASLFVYFAVIQGCVALYGIVRVLRRDPVPPEEKEDFVPMVRTSQAALEMLQ